MLLTRKRPLKRIRIICSWFGFPWKKHSMLCGYLTVLQSIPRHLINPKALKGMVICLAGSAVLSSGARLLDWRVLEVEDRRPWAFAICFLASVLTFTSAGLVGCQNQACSMVLTSCFTTAIQARCIRNIVLCYIHIKREMR